MASNSVNFGGELRATLPRVEVYEDATGSWPGTEPPLRVKLMEEQQQLQRQRSHLGGAAWATAVLDRAGPLMPFDYDADSSDESRFGS